MRLAYQRPIKCSGQSCYGRYGSYATDTPENGFQGTIKRQGGPFLGFAQVFSAIKKKLPERAPTKTCLRVLSIIDRYAITCVGTLTIRLRSIDFQYDGENTAGGTDIKQKSHDGQIKIKNDREVFMS